MTSTYITRVTDGHYCVVIDKHVLVKEGIGIGDFLEVTVRKIEKTARSDSGSPYGL